MNLVLREPRRVGRLRGHRTAEPPIHSRPEMPLGGAALRRGLSVSQGRHADPEYGTPGSRAGLTAE